MKINKGDNVIVTNGKRKLEGKVIYCNEIFFTLQTKVYRESFLWTNISNKELLVKILE